MSYLDLPEKAQQMIEKLVSKKKAQEGIIRKEKDVIAQRGETYLSKRAKNVLKSTEEKLRNAEAVYKAQLENYKAIIEEKTAIIYNETHTRTPTIIRAEVEIQSLDEEIAKIRNINEQQVQSTPLTQAPKISEAPKICSEWEQMMKDEKELEALRAARPSYIVDFSIPKTDTVYGAVSTLPPKTKRPVKSVKIINSATNLYSDEVEE